MEMNPSHQPEKDKFKEADALVEILHRTEDSQLKVLIDSNIDHWGPVLFNATRSATGFRKARYANILEKLAKLADPELYDNMLKSIMTNRAAVEELIYRTVSELDPLKEAKNKLAGLFRKKKE